MCYIEIEHHKMFFRFGMGGKHYDTRGAAHKNYLKPIGSLGFVLEFKLHRNLKNVRNRNLMYLRRLQLASLFFILYTLSINIFTLYIHRNIQVSNCMFMAAKGLTVS
jgi:hypothetical protein